MDSKPANIDFKYQKSHNIRETMLGGLILGWALQRMDSMSAQILVLLSWKASIKDL